jgi:hypothetical protein
MMSRRGPEVGVLAEARGQPGLAVRVEGGVFEREESRGREAGSAPGPTLSGVN